MAKTLVATVNERIPKGVGGRAEYYGILTFGSEYQTGGLPLTFPTIAEGARIAGPEPKKLLTLRANNLGGYVMQYDREEGKLKVFRQKDPAAAGGADIPLPEVAEGTNLSALVVTFEAVGP